MSLYERPRSETDQLSGHSRAVVMPTPCRLKLCSGVFRDHVFRRDGCSLSCGLGVSLKLALALLFLLFLLREFSLSFLKLVIRLGQNGSFREFHRHLNPWKPHSNRRSLSHIPFILPRNSIAQDEPNGRIYFQAREGGSDGGSEKKKHER